MYGSSQDVFDVAGVLREPGKPTMALTVSQYVGGALVTLPKICERLESAANWRNTMPP